VDEVAEQRLDLVTADAGVAVARRSGRRRLRAHAATLADARAILVN
jgi:hypothetical protein